MLPASASRVLRVPAEASGQRLDQWLASELQDLSRVRVQQLIEQAKVLLSGKPAKASLRLRGGEEITVAGAVSRPPLKAFPEDIPLEIIHEDDSIVVLNKPSGMVVHAGSNKEHASQGTLVNALLHRFERLSGTGGELRPGIVHRLDKDTSGLLLVAKTDQAHRKLTQQFSRREVKKTYIALVHGWMPQTTGTISSPISRDLVRRTRMTTRRSQGREALTHWKIARQIEGPYGRFSLLEVRIETGRTHQIRVHLSSVGHPVVGDTLYGAPREIKSQQKGGKALVLERNFLHAAAIQFTHPETNALASFQQPLPNDLDLWLTRIEGK